MSEPTHPTANQTQTAPTRITLSEPPFVTTPPECMVPGEVPGGNFESIRALHAAFAGLRPAKPGAAPRNLRGPLQSAAQQLVKRSEVVWHSYTVREASDSIAVDKDTHGINLPTVNCEGVSGTEPPPLFLLIPWNHEQNIREDGHADFEALRAEGKIRDRAGEVIEIKSVWHAWGAYRMDRFFQAYCRVAKAAHARGEPFPADSVRDWVRSEAERLNMPLEKAHAIIRDGCNGSKAPNSRWWRGASVTPQPPADAQSTTPPAQPA